jgi:hypothetical protein
LLLVTVYMEFLFQYYSTLFAKCAPVIFAVEYTKKIR